MSHLDKQSVDVLSFQQTSMSGPAIRIYGFTYVTAHPASSEHEHTVSHHRQQREQYML